MEYNKLSDFDINKLVAESMPYVQVVYPGDYPSISDSAVHVERKSWKYGNTEECGVDYCNNPADAWPIIFSTPIDISCDNTFEPDIFVDGESSWMAHNPQCDHWSDKNPLRAAMIVYLMMQEYE